VIFDTAVCLRHPHLPQGREAGEILRAMDAAGVDRAALLPFEAVQRFNWREANERVAALCRSHPDRFCGWGTLNHYDGPEEMDRIAGLGLRGVRIFTSWGFTPGTGLIERFYVPIAEKCRERGMLFSIEHEGHMPTLGGAVYSDCIVADALPDRPVLMSRCWTWGFWPDYLAALRECPNLVIEVGVAPSSWIRRAAEEAGADRMVMGSWWPEQEPAAVIAHVRGLGLPAEDEAKILGGTAARLFGR
jgi:predicted TIM-barrel fold metal-dependent hydrolase